MPSDMKLLYYLMCDDEEEDILLLLILFWRHMTSHLHFWLLRKRITLQRYLEERRIGVNVYFNDVLPAYHNVQFQEHFRMARATFEVTYISVLCLNICYVM